jgi:hypothetical protein
MMSGWLWTSNANVFVQWGCMFAAPCCYNTS